jgi:hypothetical protein
VYEVEEKTVCAKWWEKSFKDSWKQFTEVMGGRNMLWQSIGFNLTIKIQHTIDGVRLNRWAIPSSEDPILKSLRTEAHGTHVAWATCRVKLPRPLNGDQNLTKPNHKSWKFPNNKKL